MHDAAKRAMMLEETAKVVLYCKQFGGELTLIPDEWVQNLAGIREFPREASASAPAQEERRGHHHADGDHDRPHHARPQPARHAGAEPRARDLAGGEHQRVRPVAPCRATMK